MSTRSTVLGFTLLVLLLTAGTAQGLSGSNTVESDDIQNGAVTYGKLSCGAKTSFATVDASEAESVFSDGGLLEFRNCSGQSVQVKSLGPGVYCVKFLGNPQTRAVVSAVGSKAVVAVNTFAGSGACSPGGAKPGMFQVVTGPDNMTPSANDFRILAF